LPQHRASVVAHYCGEQGDSLKSASRRRFLETTALAGAATLAPAAVAAASGSPPLTKGWFAPSVGTAFTVRDRLGVGAQLVLTRLTPLARTHGYASSAHAAERCFSAQFEGERGTSQVTGLCTVEHPSLGTFAMTISPIGGDGKTWEAVFNRLNLS
jgi:hypothetical protein